MKRFDMWLSGVLCKILSLMQMREGIGLAVPQTGIPQRSFVAESKGHTLSLIDPLDNECTSHAKMIEDCLRHSGLCVCSAQNDHIEGPGGNHLHPNHIMFSKIVNAHSATRGWLSECRLDPR
jgi:hypothetical protein